MPKKDEELILRQQAQAQNVPVQTSAPANTAAGLSDDDINAYVTQGRASLGDASKVDLPGVSDQTKQALGGLVNAGYTPSGTVQAALGELNKIIGSQPGAFNSQYTDQLNAIMGQILGRDAFSYDFASDPAYQQYREQYTQAGRRAMEDTMGQAAQLTGGYGSSYATTAGNQAYQQHLTQLNNTIPELRNQALSQYQMEGDQLNQAYGLAGDAYSRDYAQWQDDYSRWAADRDYQQSAYDRERQYDYNEYQQLLDYWSGMADRESSQYNTDRQYENEKQYAYQIAMSMLQLGKLPSAEVLAAAGISAADAKKIQDAYKRSSGSSRSSSGSGGGSSSGSSSTAAAKPATTTGQGKVLTEIAVDAQAQRAYTQWAKTGKSPDWSAYSADTKKALNTAYNRLKHTTK